MTLDFQDSLLKYLFQDKGAKRFKDYLDQSVFDIPTFQLVYGFWYDYVTKYNSTPSKSNFLEFIDRAVRRSKGAVTQEVYDEILNTVAVVYTPDTNDYEFNKDVIIEYAQRKGMRNVFTTKADKLKNASVEELNAIYTQVQNIVRIGADTEAVEKNRGGFMFRDSDKQIAEEEIKAHPTFLHGLNKMTAARGFYSPQLILLMGGPKAFKTGLILSILIEYARMGLKVFIADAENGLADMKARIKQGYLECERHELRGYAWELKEILKRVKLYGGEIVPNFFPAYVSTLDDVDRELERLANEEDWHPDIIFYDYLQLFGSSNKKIIDKRLQIQDVYHHAIRLNNKYNTFAFTAAKVKQDAVNKLVIKVNDFGEDFAQAYNCHATFALCRTEDEVREGNGRIIPVVQRSGTAYKFGASTTCAIRISEPTQTIVELDAEAYMAVLEEEHNAKNKAAVKRRYVPAKDVDDD